MGEVGLGRRVSAEALGTSALVVAIVGSGIMAQRLTDETALRLLANALVTGAALAVLVCVLGPVSGAHFNPVVTAADRILGGISTGRAAVYVLAQVVGAVIGAIVANLMFSLPAIEASSTARGGAGRWLGEVVATSGLVTLIFLMAGTRREASIPAALGAYVAAAIWFTSSTAFANPAVTVGRMFTDTFTGIAPESVPGFVAAQVVGAALALGIVLVLRPGARLAAPDVVFDG